MLSAKRMAAPMHVAKLIKEALDDRGDAIMIIARPGDGEAAVIDTVNASFACMMDLPVHHFIGARFLILRDLVQQTADWSALLTAMTDLTPLGLDLKLRVNDRERWFGFRLTFKIDPVTRATYAIVIGRDITEARHRGILEGESQRLLASVFLRVAVPVLVVRANGIVFMTNPAFQNLFGYDATEAGALDVARLTPPEFSDAAHAARTRQLSDGNPYHLQMDTLTKDGTRVPVTLHSAFLRDARGERLRVVTLIPARDSLSPTVLEARPPQSDPTQPENRSVGEMLIISLAALKEAFGEAWERVQSRAMMMAEQVVKRSLGIADVFSRYTDDSFVIWFDDVSRTRNAAALSRITREVRLRFQTEFGEEMAAYVRSVLVDVPVGLSRSVDPFERNLPPSALLKQLHDARLHTARDAAALIQDLRATPVADIRPITDRDGKTRPVVMVDFMPEIRRQIADLAVSLPQDPDRGAEIDLLRLDLAARTLIDRSDNCNVLLPLSWSTLTATDCRRSLEKSLARIDARARLRLILAISGAPSLPSGKRWLDVTDTLRKQLNDVGLLVATGDGDCTSAQEAMVNEWPFSLLFIDAGLDTLTAPSAYFGLIAAARRRHSQVMVRSADAQDNQDWRELGATLFVG